MWQPGEYILVYPKGQTPLNRYYGEEAEAFERFMLLALDPENMTLWKMRQEMRMAVNSTLDNNHQIPW